MSRSTTAGPRDAELVGVELQPPSSLKSMGRMRRSWRSFWGIHWCLGTPVPTASKPAGARVLVTVQRNGTRARKKKSRGPRAYPLRWCTLYSPWRAATPSCASARRWWIEWREKLHRAAWLLDEDDDRRGMLGWATCGLWLLGCDLVAVAR
jgi:hypothetical protein